MPDRLLVAIADIETKLNTMQVENGFRRDWGGVILAEWPWTAENDFDRPNVQMSVATEDAPGAHGFEKAGNLHHYMEHVMISANLKPDVRADGTLDVITPVQDFRADVHRALMLTAAGRNRGLDRHMSTYYTGRRTAYIANGQEAQGARTTEVYKLLWAHVSGDMSAGPGSA